ncbi:MAG: hypothetical protein FWH24_04280 [Oscillospiraceae bacterium]|nr:hypothetical protein [Oscillospiraceae bacterium]
MKPFELYIAYISWENGGKMRPVLIYLIEKNEAVVFPVTTQYENKSSLLQKKYFKIIDMGTTGLDKQSYIDTGTSYKISADIFNENAPIGQLSENDKRRLLEFL